MIFKIKRFCLDGWFIYKERKKIGSFTSVDYLHRDLTLHNSCGNLNFYELEEAKSLLNKWCIKNEKVILEELNSGRMGFYTYEIGDDFISMEDIKI